MAAKCIICKKELPEGMKVPVCEYHKGIAADRAKQAGLGALAVGGTVVMVAKDTVIPIVKDKAVPIAKGAAKLILRH